MLIWFVGAFLGLLVITLFVSLVSYFKSKAGHLTPKARELPFWGTCERCEERVFLTVRDDGYVDGLRMIGEWYTCKECGDRLAMWEEGSMARIRPPQKGSIGITNRNQ
jgi:hypothetical protein